MIIYYIEEKGKAFLAGEQDSLPEHGGLTGF